MKKLVCFLGTVGLITASSVFAAEEVNFRAVNPVLQSLVDAVIAADETVDFAYPRFDPAASDLKAEKLKYDLQGALKNTPWLAGGKADIVATSSYATDRADGHTGINVSMSSTLRTNALAFIRYAALIEYKKGLHYSDPKFTGRIDGHLKRMAVANSLNEVYDLLLSGQALAKEMIGWDIQKEVDYLTCLRQGGCISSGTVDLPKEIADQIRRIENRRTALKGAEQIQFNKTEENGKVRSFTVMSADMDLFLRNKKHLLIQPLRSTIAMSDESVAASAAIFAPKTSAELDDLKTKLNNRLLGAQNGDLDEKEKIEKSFRDALIEYRKVIQGEF
ncbi:MAG: hypothetical protein H7222_10530 [Methylotenera sp.]|nr:hypothetical protein [Oligoflexia bacterium]